MRIDWFDKVNLFRDSSLISGSGSDGMKTLMWILTDPLGGF